MPSHPPEILAAIPIPSYEEATSSRPTTSHSRLGPAESSDDAERQGLLVDDVPERSADGASAGRSGNRRGNYRAPTMESARNSTESDLTSLASARSSDDRLRREVSQMDIEEPPLGYGRAGQSRIRDTFTKQITYITQSLSSISRPLHGRLPSLASLRNHILRNPTPSLIIMGRVCALVLVFAVVYYFVSEISLGRGTARQNYDADSIRRFIQRHVESERVDRHLEHLSRFDHLAGTQGDFYLAEYVLKELAAVGLDQTELNRSGIPLSKNKPIDEC